MEWDEFTRVYVNDYSVYTIISWMKGLLWTR